MKQFLVVSASYLAFRPRQDWALLGIRRAVRVMAFPPRILIHTWVPEVATTGQERARARGHINRVAWSGNHLNAKIAYRC